MKGNLLWDILVKYGIDSYRMSIYTPIPSTAEQQIPISKQIPQQVGLIFGLSTYTDTVTPANQNLITTTNAGNLYLTFKDGPTEFFQPIRLNEMIYDFIGFPNTNQDRYMPVNINGNFDMSTSYYANPTNIVAGETNPFIALNLWYISTNSYVWLMENKIIEQNIDNFLRGKRK